MTGQLPSLCLKGNFLRTSLNSRLHLTQLDSLRLNLLACVYDRLFPDCCSVSMLVSGAYGLVGCFLPLNRLIRLRLSNRIWAFSTNCFEFPDPLLDKSQTRNGTGRIKEMQRSTISCHN